MIVARLMGGVGNQMFQYAAALALAERHAAVLKLDHTFLKGEQKGCTRREYALDRFAVSAEPATAEEIARFSGKGVGTLNRIGLLVRSRLGRISICREHEGCDILQAPDNVLLEGYWQSERYFQGVEQRLRKEFTYQLPFSPAHTELAEQLAVMNSVAVHVRRGDYLHSPVHALCDIGYYQRSLQLIEQRVPDAVPVFFSDDPVWTRQMFGSLKNALFVDSPETDDACADLALMSRCCHAVIANSSFSWWGAWLNSNPDKIVCAPARWFSGNDRDAQELVPDEWVRL